MFSLSREKFIFFFQSGRDNWFLGPEWDIFLGKPAGVKTGLALGKAQVKGIDGPANIHI